MIIHKLLEKLFAQSRCAVTLKTFLMLSGINLIQGILTRIQIARKEAEVPLMRHLIALIAQRVCAVSSNRKQLIQRWILAQTPPFRAYRAYRAFRLFLLPALRPVFASRRKRGMRRVRPLSTSTPTAREAPPSVFVRWSLWSYPYPHYKTILD